MKITVLTPEREVFAGEIKSLKVPGNHGQFEILNNHAPIVSSLGEGQVRMMLSDAEAKSFLIKGGFVEVLNNEISLLVTGVSEE